MEGLRQYLLTIASAAIICAMVTAFFGKKSSYSSVIKLLTGIFMAIAVISPWIKLQFSDITDYVRGISMDGEQISVQGQNIASEEYRSIIKSQSEAYILDKAAFMGVDVSVEITLCDSDPPTPQSVTIKGAVSPFARSSLQDYISSQLGIPKENQTWI